KPCGLTKEPEPPSFRRTEESRRWSSHCCVGVKPYFSLSSLSGGLSKVHMPSSARTAGQRRIVASSAAEACRTRAKYFTDGVLFSNGVEPWKNGHLKYIRLRGRGYPRGPLERVRRPKFALRSE